MRLFQGATLIAATMTVGLMAGVFGLYAHSIMPGLRDTDDRTFVGAFQSLDRAIINPLFMATFMGALLLTGLTAVLHFGADERDVLPWILGAFVLYLAVFIITVAANVPLNDDIAANVPLNDDIKAAGDPDQIADLAAVRDQFDEGRWAAWNIVRAVASTIAFGCLLWALVQFGRVVESSGG